MTDTQRDESVNCRRHPNARRAHGYPSRMSVDASAVADVGSPRRRALVAGRRLAEPLRRHVSGRDAGTSVGAHVRETGLRPQRFGPPRRLRKDVTIDVRGFRGWPVYEFTPADDRDPDRAVVYFHGGAWVHQIAKPHWRFVAQLSAEAGLRVLVPIYPLVPVGTAADVVPTARDLAVRAVTGHRDLVLAGDSAGGQIALSVALALRDDVPSFECRTVLISPALDIALRNPDVDDAATRDRWLEPESLREYGRWWRGDLPDDHPWVSPLQADLAGLGPLTVISGTADLLNPDARRLVREARAVDVPVTFREAAGAPHVFALAPTSEGRRARRRLVDDLRDDRR